MKAKHFNLAFLLVALCTVRSAGAIAQSSLPPLKPVTAEARQKLRTAILHIAKAHDPEYSNVHGDLALPLAQLGDWSGALRLL